MIYFLPVLLLELCVVGSIIAFCLSRLVSTYRATRAKRYDEAIAALSPVMLFAVFCLATAFWINH